MLLIPFLLLVPLVVSRPATPDVYTKTIRMTGAMAKRSDDLLCHSMRMEPNAEYILEFEPHATKEIAHHMVLWGCNKPASKAEIWDCNDMENVGSESGICSEGMHEIVYAWALDAPRKKLPKGVGFRVGGTTNIQYIVLQLHYREAFPYGIVDDFSGVTLHMTREAQPEQAGYYILLANGELPPGIPKVNVDMACVYDGEEPIYPFAYRTHSHNLGVVTSGYRIRAGKWDEIGRMSPRQPQMFYTASKANMAVRKGDVLAARCTMTTEGRTDVTRFGPRNRDEMCNFYIMYRTTRQDDLTVQMCGRYADFRLNDYFSNIPKTISSLEGVNLMEPELEKDSPAKNGTMRLV